jgi:hypothetical protein
MTIKEKIMDYLEKNFDGRVLLIVDGEPHLYYDNSTLCYKMTELFELWASENENPMCQDPIKLFDYCLEIHDFGDICSLYYEDSSGDFCLESPYDL